MNKGLIAAFVVIGLGVYGMNNVNFNSAGADEPVSVGGKPVKNNINLSAPSLPSDDAAELVTKDLILSASNTIVFRSDVNAISVAQTQRRLLDMDASLGQGRPIYLVLDTPGGSISAGNSLIDTARSLRRPVHTITIFAASMGFAMVQRLGTRYVLPSGTLMAHRAHVSEVSGQIPGEFITAAANLFGLVTRLEKQNAARLGISFEDYTALVRDEYWVEGEDGVRQGAADALASIKCDSSLKGSYYESISTFFGEVRLEWSNCPAVTYPLGFAFDGSPVDRAAIAKSLSNYKHFRTTLVKGLSR